MLQFNPTFKPKFWYFCQTPNARICRRTMSESIHIVRARYITSAQYQSWVATSLLFKNVNYKLRSRTPSRKVDQCSARLYEDLAVQCFRSFFSYWRLTNHTMKRLIYPHHADFQAFFSACVAHLSLCTQKATLNICPWSRKTWQNLQKCYKKHEQY